MRRTHSFLVLVILIALLPRALPGAGRVIDSQAEVGGWPSYPRGEAPADSDGDGMPDAWERQRGLDPGDSSDGPKDRDGDGYTNLEEFLNALAE